MNDPKDEEEARSLARYIEQCNQFNEIVAPVLLSMFPTGKVTYSLSYLVYFKLTDINEPDFEFTFDGKRYSIGPSPMSCDCDDPYCFRIFDYQTLDSEIFRFSYLPPVQEWVNVIRKRFQKREKYEQLYLF